MLNHHLEREYPCTYHKEVGYPYRVWIFSILLAPLIFEATEFSITADENFSITYFSFAFYFEALIQLTILCLPVILCYIIAFWMISAINISPIGKKMLLASIGIIGMYLVGSIVTGRLFNIFLASERHFLVYTTVFLTLSLACRLEKK